MKFHAQSDSFCDKYKRTTQIAVSVDMMDTYWRGRVLNLVF
jgi:hypothetical protein